jgi:hypothetical protein
VDALTTDTEQRTGDLDFQKFIPWQVLRRLRVAVAGLVALFAVLLVAYPELRTAALRLMLLPVHYTRLEVAPGDHSLKVGHEMTVEATLSGRPVDKAELLYRETGNDRGWMSLALDPTDTDSGDRPARLTGTLRTTLKDCQTDLEYRVVAGAVESPLYRLTVLRPLVLTKTEARVEPPAYTRRPSSVSSAGNFKVIEGSRVQFRFTLDRPPQDARLKVVPLKAPQGNGGARTQPLHVEGSELTGELADVRQEVEYEVLAEAADGMRLEGARFRIQVQPDRKPAVRFLKPKEQIEVTPTTEVVLRVEAADDFGLSKVGIVYQVGAGPKQTLYLQEPTSQPAKVLAEAVLALEDHEVTFQDAVSYYAFAEDNRPGSPQRTTTELQFIDIRPFQRSYQLLKTGGS